MDDASQYIFNQALSQPNHLQNWSPPHHSQMFFDSPNGLDAHYSMLHQPQQQQQGPLQMGASSSSSAAGAEGVLTRQRARAAAQQQLSTSPLHVQSNFQRMALEPNAPPPTFDARQPLSMQPPAFPDPSSSSAALQLSNRPLLSLSMMSGPVHGSPPFPSTPTTSMSSGSASNSRVYYSNGRSTSPAASVASSSLTSLSGGASHPALHSTGGDCPELGTVNLDTALTHGGVPLSMGDVDQDAARLATGRSPTKHRKQRLYNIDRKSICHYSKSHPEARQEDIAARYGVERSTISKILKQKNKWLNVPEGDEMKIIKHRPSKFPMLEKKLLSWLKQCTRDKVHLTDSLIRSKARETAREIGIGEDKFKASSGWVENFKHRHGIRRGVLIGRPRRVHMGNDGEPVYSDDGSDEEDALEPGEPEGLTKEEREEFRAREKQLRMEMYKVAEEQIDAESREQYSAGEIDAELRTELILVRRAQLMKCKREGRPLEEAVIRIGELPTPNDPVFVHNAWFTAFARPRPDGTAGALLTHPAPKNMSIPNLGVLYSCPAPPVPEHPTAGQAFIGIDTALHFLDDQPKEFIPEHQRVALENVRGMLGMVWAQENPLFAPRQEQFQEMVPVPMPPPEAGPSASTHTQ